MFNHRFFEIVACFLVVICFSLFIAAKVIPIADDVRGHSVFSRGGGFTTVDGVLQAID